MVIYCGPLREVHTFSIAIKDVIYLRTRFMLYIFFFSGRNSTRSTHLYLHLYIETFISSPLLTFIAMDGASLCFGSLVRFLSIRFGGRFRWNGRWFKLSDLEYFPIYAEL